MPDDRSTSGACICDPWEIGKTPACPVHSTSGAQSYDVAALYVDPAGVYARMDFHTRDDYRHVIEAIAKRSRWSEVDVARAVLQLARLTLRVIKQNLFWAFAYNVAAIPLAMLGILPPGLAAAAMMLSSLSVVANALRLYRVKLP